VSGQLEAEAFACALSKVYTFGPTFRAENSNTSRHANEFWMIEPEMAFLRSGGDMDLAEELVKYLVRDIEKIARMSLGFSRSLWTRSCSTALSSWSNGHSNASATAKRSNSCEKRREVRVPGRVRPQPAIRTRALADRETLQIPLHGLQLSKEIKPFYMRLNDDGKTVTAMDLLVPGIGEIIGGSQREERLEVLEENLRHHK
jgi:asparaginyl-tRNA synthetase